MGNGPKNTPDVAKAPPYEAHRVLATAQLGAPGLTAGEGAGGPAAATIVDFCERTHRLQIELRTEAQAQVGDPVRLVWAPVPRVVGAAGDDLGALAAPQTAAIQQCLIDGYSFAGEITSVGGASPAEIEVRGVRLE
jgi:hypothetical protein